MIKQAIVKNILFSGLIAGTLDISAAILFLANGNAAGVLKYIASGAFGKDAFTGGDEMLAWGVLFHYLIAMSFATFYFLIYPHLPFLRQNKWINALLYGIFVWATMNLLIVPMSHITSTAFNWVSALKNIAILVVCIGLPISLLADRFYKGQRLINV